jgi:tripartite-type tricarboxylate transporter receptor subunit TctC
MTFSLFRFRYFLVALTTMTLSSFAFNTGAQGWPDKPVRIIVAFPPGGGTDFFARPLAVELSKTLGQQVFVDNRVGAGGTIGAAAAAKAPPDGYTIFAGAVHHTVADSVYKNLSYKLSQDFIPVRGIAFVPDVLIINSKLPITTVKELVDYAKKNPGKVNFGSSGNGTSRHIAGEVFNKLAGTSITHIPYKGAGPAMMALLGGEVDLIFNDLASVASQINSGAVRALAVTAPKRSPAFPNIPTMAEAGIPGFESISWYGFWVPKGTPQIIQDRIFVDTTNALNTPGLQTIWRNSAADTGPDTQKQFSKYVEDETDRWKKLVNSYKITAE